MTIPKRMRYALLAATLAATTGGIAVAQNAQNAATYDPAQLPATKGKVAQYSLTPRGDVDGLILDDGTEIHFPPHLGTQLVFLVKPGDSVTVNGLKARNVAMVMALQITNDATGKSVADSGPPPREHGPGPAAPGPGRPGGPGPMGQTLEAQGVVKAQLHGPRGDLNGVLLQDGTIVRLPPPEAQRREAALAVGKTVFVQGDGLASPLGRVVAARTIGTSAQDATALPMPPPRDRHGPQLAGPGAPPPPPTPTSN